MSAPHHVSALTVMALALLSACSEMECDCASRVDYEGSTYSSVGALEQTPPTVRQVTPGVVPGCCEDEPDERVRVYELRNIRPEVAIWVNKELYVSQELFEEGGRNFPKKIRDLLR